MSNPIKNDNGRKVPKVARVRVRHSSGEELGNSPNFTVVLTLGEKVSEFLFSVQFQWPKVIESGSYHLNIPVTMKPIIENEKGEEVSEGKCVVYKEVPGSLPKSGDDMNTIAIQLGYVSMDIPEPDPIPSQSDIPYKNIS